MHAECTCNFYQQNKLFKGPCEHILALRIAHARGQMNAPVVTATQATPAPKPAPQSGQPSVSAAPKPASAPAQAKLKNMEEVLDRVMRALVDDDLIDLDPHSHSTVLNEMLAASKLAIGVDNALAKAREALLESTSVDDVYATEKELKDIFAEAYDKTKN